ncbi:TPA: hypothetical protein RQJ98_004609 [Vibrio vulnificus]|uniref:hypothetical protein n=1 Tax=Vibrio vulnificus TaxID=672 RepID=UPI0005F12AC0|nr:hypothetical protein [Vibrio vulnificus]MCA3916944.1 hypothetical protein [Vibrio vulnificus]MCG6312806.1 hypothetical protein [Vibrio vulnificus]HAS6364286.1 hypothetical protein [Vibrio vulnificus]HDY7544930.1 hypothetical protein [Vibrio vulnificus]HDY7685947.1 hypothetical protein [Vibrio vulnificus]
MNKKVLTIVTIIAVFGIAILTKPKSGGLELPNCNFEKMANTKINFFVDQEVLDSSSIEEIKKSLNTSIKYANQVLKNSCVPLTRSLGDVAPLHIDKNEVRSLVAARKLIRTVLEKQKILVEQLSPNEKYGLIFHGKYEKQLGLSGQASPYFGSWFFAISSTAQIHALEHELGHLSWAQHSESHPVRNLTMFLKFAVPQEYQEKLVPYARAFKCGDSGTIMSYERNILPIYSSPQIKYQGEFCGNSTSGDNARVLRDYALTLLEPGEVGQ